MSEKKKSLLITGIGALLAAILGGLIYMQHQKITETETEIASLEDQIAKGLEIIAKTPELEREVIIQRETDEVIAEILPDAEELTDFVRTLRKFEEQSGIRITDIRNRPGTGDQKQDFDKVVYSLKLNGDAFQMLAFFNLVESHSRFMSVPRIRLTAAQRSQLEDANAGIRHEIDIDVETYVYEPKSGSTPVRIENFEHKRNLLLGEISHRQQALAIETYEYRGPRGRRDPWVDPRIPITEGDSPLLTIEEQIELVDGMVARVDDARRLYAEFLAADGLVEEMRARRELEEALVTIGDDILRIEQAAQLSFVSAELRFGNEVVEGLAMLRSEFEGVSQPGPSLEELQAIAGSMRTHLQLGEFEFALGDFESLVERLEHVPSYDTERVAVAEEILQLKNAADAFKEFEEFEIQIDGLLHYEGSEPVAVINGISMLEGEFLDTGVLVQSIGANEIDFLYRGVTFSKSLRQ